MTEHCVCCGEEIPEGRTVCRKCEQNVNEVCYWVQDDRMHYHCSNCGHKRGYEAQAMRYCPMCGRRMDGV